MGRRAKKLERFRQNPKNVRYEELEGVLLYLGFKKGVEGAAMLSFHILGVNRSPFPLKKPFLKQAYVRQAIRAIDELNLMDID